MTDIFDSLRLWIVDGTERSFKLSPNPHLDRGHYLLELTSGFITTRYSIVGFSSKLSTPSDFIKPYDWRRENEYFENNVFIQFGKYIDQSK